MKQEEKRFAAMGDMKALHYDGPFKVAVRNVARPKLEHPDDVIIKVSPARESWLCVSLTNLPGHNNVHLRVRSPHVRGEDGS